ncbi:glycosyltransferase family 2 protein [Ancylobacter dichloromethanicus]|uniref:Glycosyl transferase family 2 n=1 Tax=Ancylobacter dichloromethanicus TaxID=518825 RepID=A0A9W6MZ88_9HYPH|nr:glycosyltransferase family 2 protein [Ancylobacter dichloromethanicus]MBS7554626.1 glycosyltransferase family 2 protein [Ancylobacter dichloromethanicus]GLK71757.1 hypothetical protein GCM10017643_18720 [Ancylobacter dichloromethanicus]
MRIAGVSLVKDEADIIEAFVRHNLHFLDKLYVVDDGSSDNTAEILARLAAEFPTDGTPAVEIVRSGWTGSFHQGQRTTQLMRHAREQERWDMIVPLDADELICTSDRASLERSLAAAPAGFALGVGCLNYYAMPHDDASIEDPVSRITTAVESAQGHIFKCIASAALTDEAEFAFDEGNHALLIGKTRVPSVAIKDVRLAHFAVRSPDQIASKCLKHYVGWRSRHDYRDYLAQQPIAGVMALKSEPHFALLPGSEVVRVYVPDEAVRNGVHRPFTERRGTLKWPELATQRPYSQLVALLDRLIERAALSDQLAQAGASDDSPAASLRTLIDERNALAAELSRLRNSTAELTGAYRRLVGLRLRLSLRKRRIGLQKLLGRLTRGGTRQGLG